MYETFVSWLFYANDNNTRNHTNNYKNNKSAVNIYSNNSNNNNVKHNIANTTHAPTRALALQNFNCEHCQKLRKHQSSNNKDNNNKRNNKQNKQNKLFIYQQQARKLMNIRAMNLNIYATPYAMKTTTAALSTASYDSWAHLPVDATYNSTMLLDRSSHNNISNNNNNNYSTSNYIDIDVATTAGGSSTYLAPAIAHVLLAPSTAKTAAAAAAVTTTTASAAVAAMASPIAAVTPLVQDLLPTLLTRNATYLDAATSAAAAGNSNVSTRDENADNLNSFYFYETEQFAVLWILFTVIVLGNSAVLFVMFINKNRKSRMNYFIKQLALADLSVGLLNVLTDIIWRITISWRAGNIACKVIRFSQVCVTYSSTYVLVAMSIDRYDAITHPMNFSKSWKRARHLVIGAWMISAIFSLPILLLYEEKLIQGQTQCWIELGSPFAWQIYMSLVSMTLFAIPALIISACYAIIVKTIWSKGSMFIPAAERAGLSNPPARRASSRGIIPRAKVKTVKMTFVIVIVFILCWSPYIVFDLLQVFGQIPQTQTNVAIATFIQSLAPLNSAANPLIYCLFSSQVFRTLSRFRPFKWFTCCCKSYRNNSTQTRCHTVGRRLHNSCDSMRTLTTSLTVSSRRSTKPTARVVICERPKCVAAMSEV